MAAQEDLLLAIGRLEGKVDCLIASISTHDDELGKLDRRCRRLELSKSWMLGAAAAVGAVSSYILNFLGNPK